MNSTSIILDRFTKLDSLQQSFIPQEPTKAAAVLIAITQDEHSEIILTRRADHLNAHSGEVSLPGGRFETIDKQMQQTALREAQEEIALNAGLVNLKGALKPRLSKYGLTVTPFVGLIPAGLKLIPCVNETANVFSVPVNFFLHSKPNIYTLTRGAKSLQVPSWHYEEFYIWGLTAMFIMDLIQRLQIPHSIPATVAEHYGH